MPNTKNNDKKRKYKPKIRIKQRYLKKLHIATLHKKQIFVYNTKLLLIKLFITTIKIPN